MQVIRCFGVVNIFENRATTSQLCHCVEGVVQRQSVMKNEEAS